MAQSHSQKDGTSTALGILAFVVALGTGFFVAQCARAPERGGGAEVVQGPRQAVALRGDEPQRGPDDALVTIVEFGDYECPFCARARRPLEAVLAENPDVRLVYKHYPLPKHERAAPAARAAWAAHQQGKFWPAHEILFDTAGDLDVLLARAEALGLERSALAEAMVSSAAVEAVDDDFRAGATLAVNATPIFFVNGHRYRGLLTAADWEAILEAEREAAMALVRRGTPRAEVYERLVGTDPAARG